MSSTYRQMIQTIINESKNLAPQLSGIILFDRSGEIIASDGDIEQEQTSRFIADITSLNEQTEALGSIENISLQGTDSHLNIVVINPWCLATVASQGSNQKVVKSLTTILLPTIIRFAAQVASEPTHNPPATTLPQAKSIEKASPPQLPARNDPLPKPRLAPKPQLSPQLVLPRPPINQFMVEKIDGLFVPSDIVRVDGDTVTNWSRFYEGKQITHVNIETLDGKTVTCKFKPQKDTGHSAKGIIQIPEKILGALQTSKGKLVMVKPVIEA